MAIASLSGARGIALSAPSLWLLAFFRREPALAGTALALIALMAPTAVALGLDDRTLQGVNVWMKPLKFEIALVVYTATLAWFAGWLPEGTTTRRWYRIFVGLMVLSTAAEMTWLLYAAANGVASHFNRDHPVLRAIYPAMGLIAIFLTSATLVHAWLIARDRASRLDPVFRLSLVIGLGATFAATVLAAGAMAAGPGHFIGAGPGARDISVSGIAIFGWARDGGDLRVAHFFATHAMHALPLVGWLSSRTLPPALGKAVVAVSAALYLAFIAWTFARAMSGRPFPPLLS